MPLHCRKSRVNGLMALLVVSGAGCTPPVEVCDLAPRALNEMPDLQMLIGEVEEISLPNYFGDPCRRELSYTASSSASAVTVSITGATLTVTAVEEVDSAIVRVEAGNSENQFAVHRFYVSVELPNRAPIAVGSIPDTAVQAGRWIELGSVSDNFNDPDGDPLVYDGISADPSIARVVGVKPNGERNNVHGVRVGSTTITITATDPEGLSDSIEFDVTVTPFTGGGSPPGEMHMSEKLFEVPPRSPASLPGLAALPTESAEKDDWRCAPIIESPMRVGPAKGPPPRPGDLGPDDPTVNVVEDWSENVPSEIMPWGDCPFLERQLKVIMADTTYLGDPVTPNPDYIVWRGTEPRPRMDSLFGLPRGTFPWWFLTYSPRVLDDEEPFLDEVWLQLISVDSGSGSRPDTIVHYIAAAYPGIKRTSPQESPHPPILVPTRCWLYHITESPSGSWLRDSEACEVP